MVFFGFFVGRAKGIPTVGFDGRTIIFRAGIGEATNIGGFDIDEVVIFEITESKRGDAVLAGEIVHMVEMVNKGVMGGATAAVVSP